MSMREGAVAIAGTQQAAELETRRGWAFSPLKKAPVVVLDIGGVVIVQDRIEVLRHPKGTAPARPVTPLQPSKPNIIESRMNNGKKSKFPLRQYK